MLENADKFSLAAVLHVESLKCGDIASRLGLARFVCSFRRFLLA